MSQPRFVPITITVDDKDRAKVSPGFTNAFDDLDKSSQKAASGGLKSAFDSSSHLRTNLQGLGQDSNFVRDAMAVLDADVAKLTPNLNNAGVGAGNVAAQAVGAGTGLKAMLNPIGALVIALPLLISLFSGVVFGATSLAKHAGEAGSQIHELQQKTNFQAETLSTLSVAAKLSGSDIQDLSVALNTFDKNIARANQSDTRLAKQLRDSNVDISNNERALRSVFRVLAQMPDEMKQVEMANLAFGASGKEVLGVIKETNGDIDVAMKKYAGLSLILSSDSTKAAAKFTDQLTLLDLQIDAVKVRVGQQFMPVVLDVVQRISTYVKDNQQRWVEWARSAVDSGRDIKAGAELVGEAYVSMNRDAARVTPAFALVDSSIQASLGNVVRYATGLGVVVTALEKLGNLTNRLKAVSPTAIPAQEVPNLATPLRPGGFTTEQLDKFQKELTPFQNLFESIDARVKTFGQSSHLAAVQQQALKLQVKELSPEVRDQAQAFIQNALAQAKHLDALEAQQKAADEAVKQAEKQTQANQNLSNEIDAVKLRTLQLGDAEGKTRTELEKFNEALIKRKDQDLLNPNLIDAAREAYAGLDRTLAQIAKNKAFDKLAEDRKEVANSLQSIRENINLAAAQALPDLEQRLAERDQILHRTARSIESIAKLKIDRTQFAGLVDLFKGAEAADLEKAHALLQKQLDPKVLENIAPKDIAQIVDLLFKAADADRQLLAAASPLAQAHRELNAELKRLQDEVPIAAETAATRYQIAWQDAYNGVALASDAAAIKQIYSQAKLADATIYHADQANASVMDFLASQRSVTEVITDAKVGVIQTTFDLIDRGLDKATSKLGIMQSLVKDLLSGFIRLALSKFFQSLYGGAGVSSAGGGGGITGFLSNVVGGLRGGGGVPLLTGGFAGGPGGGAFFGGFGSGATNAQSAQARALSGIGAGSLFGLGAGPLSVPQSLSSQLANQQGIAAAIHESGHAAAGGAATGALAGGGLMASLGAMLPILGLSVGAGLGGTSRFGSVLGGAGGLIAGGIGAAFLAPGLFAAGGLFGSMGPAIAGLLTNPFTAVAAGALIIGALLLGRNSARRRDETTRNQAMLDSLGQLDEIIRAVKTDKMDVTSGVAAAMQIRQQYVTAMGALRDSKTRRIALQDVYRLDLKIDEIRKAGEGQQRRRDIEKRLVPEFAYGGTVPYGNTMFSMMTGLTPIKVRPGEVMIPPGGFGITVPGVDRGYDSVYTMAPPRTRVLTKSQASSARGFDRGGIVGGFGGDDRPIEVHVHLSPKFVVDKDAAGEVVSLGATTSDGRRAIVKVYDSRRFNGN